MLSFLFNNRTSSSIPQQLYGRLMAQARSREFYSEFGVSDSVMGRYDVLSLHVYLFARRLRAEDSEVSIALSQDVFDQFTADIERALRELGIGDTTVPKRKKAMIHSFYAQIDEFDPLIAKHDIELLSQRMQERFAKESSKVDGKAMSRYTLKLVEVLKDQSFAGIKKGDLELPAFEREERAS
jgi:cytochrome b pre-mRNA-processing protein 3